MKMAKFKKILLTTSQNFSETEFKILSSDESHKDYSVAKYFVNSLSANPALN